ncbi:hypothetical protein TNCV_1908241 [Trichonephila clavipes]|nr:hypothetical protein TNCV_1908241 [Trichonephila clavipes]
MDGSSNSDLDKESILSTQIVSLNPIEFPRICAPEGQLTQDRMTLINRVDAAERTCTFAIDTDPRRHLWQ